MVKVEDVTEARAGSAFNGPAFDVVGPACENNNGKWFCNTHRQMFENQLQKDIHIHRGKHELVWVCFQHGPEQP